MATRRKKHEPAADQGDANETLAGEIVHTDFPPQVPTSQVVVQSVASNTGMPPDQGHGK